MQSLAWHVLLKLDYAATLSPGDALPSWMLMLINDRHQEEERGDAPLTT
jgi:hypothetical protein